MTPPAERVAVDGHELVTATGPDLVIEHLGMVVPGMALIFLMAWFAGERRVLLLTALSLGVPLGLYVFFVHIANIPIPLGWFESLRG